jgi:hypothetical protein
MPYTGEQLAQCAREAAKRVLRVLEKERLVARFVDSYVARFDRPGLKASRLRYRELQATIGREALLAMLARMYLVLPQHLTRRRGRTLRGAEAEAAAAFREQLFASIQQALKWTPAEMQQFERDLILYAQLAARQPQPMAPRKPAEPAEGAFADRCALLLDPALLEKARQAAGEFLVELERLSERILEEVLKKREE